MQPNWPLDSGKKEEPVRGLQRSQTPGARVWEGQAQRDALLRSSAFPLGSAPRRNQLQRVHESMRRGGRGGSEDGEQGVRNNHVNDACLVERSRRRNKTIVQEEP